MLGFLASIFKPASEVAQKYIEGKHKIEGARIDFEVAKFAAKAKSLEGEYERAHSLDELASQERREGWKDEILFATILAPLWVTIAEAMGLVDVGTSKNMFAALQSMPVEYQILVGLLFVAVFGFRSLLRLYLKTKMGKKD